MVDYLEPVFSVVVSSRGLVRMVKPEFGSEKNCDVLDLFGSDRHFKPSTTDNVRFLDVGGKALFELLYESIFSFVRKAHPCSYTFDLRIFSWSMMIACSKASGLGGQPGTYTSTGTNSCAPFTIL